MATNNFSGPNTTSGNFGDFSMLPSPIQQAIKRAKIVQGKPEAGNYSGLKEIASVDRGNTDTITIHDPSRWVPQTLAHEATHLWQNSLPKGTLKDATIDPKHPYYDDDKLAQSLIDARKQGLKFENLSLEHQAQVVQAYTASYKDKYSRELLQPWMEDITRIDNAAQLERLLHAPVLPSGKNVAALYNSQKGN